MVVKIEINNMPLEVEEGTTILNAAKKVGINVPTLCYLEGLQNPGSCRPWDRISRIVRSYR